MQRYRKVLLGTELVILFIFLPLAFFFNLIPGHKSIPLLIVFIYCLILLLRDKTFNRKSFGMNSFNSYRIIFIRFLVLALLITAYMFFLERDHFFEIVLQKPWLWALIMVAYPVWSIYPQELIFRPFFFHRYKPLLQNEQVLVYVNAALFGFIHIIFMNWIAVAGACVAGYFFATTWLKSRSVMAVWIEHVLYGNFIFTAGLGHYFYRADF